MNLQQSGCIPSIGPVLVLLYLWRDSGDRTHPESPYKDNGSRRVGACVRSQASVFHQTLAQTKQRNWKCCLHETPDGDKTETMATFSPVKRKYMLNKVNSHFSKMAAVQHGARQAAHVRRFLMQLLNNEIPAAPASLHSLPCVVCLGVKLARELPQCFPITAPEDTEAS